MTNEIDKKVREEVEETGTVSSLRLAQGSKIANYLRVEESFPELCRAVARMKADDLRAYALHTIAAYKQRELSEDGKGKVHGEAYARWWNPDKRKGESDG